MLLPSLAMCTAARCLISCALLGCALALEERAVSTKKIARTILFISFSTCRRYALSHSSEDRSQEIARYWQANQYQTVPEDYFYVPDLSAHLETTRALAEEDSNPTSHVSLYIRRAMLSGDPNYIQNSNDIPPATKHYILKHPVLSKLLLMELNGSWQDVAYTPAIWQNMR